MFANWSWRVAVLAVTLFIAAPAFAKDETVFEALGGAGDRQFNLNCDAGKYLVGMKGGQGAWVDRVGIICKPMGDRGVPWGPLNETEEWGGGGGGDYHKFCREGYFVGGYSVQLTADNKRVQVLRLYCMSNDEVNWPKYTMAAGSEAIGGRSFENYCPPGQIGSGLHGRSGKDVNSAALICRDVVVPAASPAPAPPRPPEKPIKSSHGAPGSNAAPGDPSGSWDMRNGNGEHYVLELSRNGGDVSGTIRDDQGAVSAVTGRFFAGGMLNLHYSLPGRSGEEVIFFKGDKISGADKASGTPWSGARLAGNAAEIPPAAPPLQFSVTANDDVDVYDGPDGSFHVIGVMERGAAAQQLDHREGWCKLAGVAEGRDGWVAEDHLTGCQ